MTKGKSCDSLCCCPSCCGGPGPRNLCKCKCSVCGTARWRYASLHSPDKIKKKPRKVIPNTSTFLLIGKQHIPTPREKLKVIPRGDAPATKANTSGGNATPTKANTSGGDDTPTKANTSGGDAPATKANTPGGKANLSSNCKSNAAATDGAGFTAGPHTKASQNTSDKKQNDQENCSANANVPHDSDYNEPSEIKLKPAQKNRVRSSTARDANYQTFTEKVKSLVFCLEENVWVMPCYKPETCKLSGSLWAVIQRFVPSQTCSCSCEHYRVLRAVEGNKLCWHLSYLQDNCDQVKALRFVEHTHECDEHIDDNQDVMEDEDINTRGLHNRPVLMEGEVEMDIAHCKVLKVPNQLQWLVMNLQISGEFCWVYYSKVQHKVKCRSRHPNSPVHKGHACAVVKWIDKHMKNWKAPEIQQTSEHLTNLPLSKLLIDSQLPDAVRKKIAEETESNTPKEYRPEVELLPESCECGGKWKKDDDLFCKGTYYALTFKASVAVYCRRCERNECYWHFDGQSSGIFNYSGETLISYSLLQMYTISCLSSATTWQAFQHHMEHMYNNVFCESAKQMKFMSLPTLIQVVKAYMMKLKVSVNLSPCKCCGIFPKKLLFDGTECGLAFRHLLNSYHTWFDSTSVESTTVVAPLKDRQLLTNKRTKDLLLNFASEWKTFTIVSWRLLMQSLTNECPSLHAVLLHLHTHSTTQRGEQGEDSSDEDQEPQTLDRFAWVKPWKPLLKVLGSFDSIAPLVPTKQVAIATGVAQGVFLDPNLPPHIEFTQHCPVIANIAAHYNNTWPNFAADLLKDILRKCSQPFNGISGPTHPAQDTGLEFWQEGHWYPFWPRIRQGLKYSKYYTATPQSAAAAKNNHARAFFEREAANHIDDGRCRKKDTWNSTQRSQTPGVFISCCEHGVTYGFHIMVDPEGRKDLFYTLYERYPQEALSELTVIYDFACNAYEYCLNREPHMFQHVKFVVDRFHYNGHKCSSLFSMDSYSKLSKVNSSFLESTNSFVNNFKTQLSQMNQFNYMHYLRTILLLHNQGIHGHLEETLGWAV